MSTATSPAVYEYPVAPPDSFTEIAQALVNPGTAATAFQKLTVDLAELRTSLSPEEWREFVRGFRDHPLLQILHQDAFTARGFRKPRGYAGDAVLIDMIYGSGEGEAMLAKASVLGKWIYSAAMSEPMMAATRGRRDLLAKYIDDVARATPNPNIMSVACGHLREAAFSTALKEGRVGRFVGLDQDRRSLRVIQRSIPGVDCIAASIDELMDGSRDPGRFDFIYAAGLYDYLDVSTGQRLLQAMGNFIKPKGRILVANFLPGLADAGYMEAAMDWWLIYRNEEEMLPMADDLPGCVSKRVFRDAYEHLAYLELQF